MKQSHFSKSLRTLATALICSVALLSAAQASDTEAGSIKISHPHAAPTVPGLKTGGVFFDAISNHESVADRLLAASSPVAKQVEIHSMKMQGDIMRMRQVDGVDISQDNPVSFQRGQPDSYHLMLMNLKQPLKLGESFALTLQFERAGEIEVIVAVEKHRIGGTSHPHRGKKPEAHQLHKKH